MFKKLFARYEYNFFHLWYARGGDDSEATLKQLLSEGWEIVSVTPNNSINNWSILGYLFVLRRKKSG